MKRKSSIGKRGKCRRRCSSSATGSTGARPKSPPTGCGKDRPYRQRRSHHHQRQRSRHRRGGGAVLCARQEKSHQARYNRNNSGAGRKRNALQNIYGRCCEDTTRCATDVRTLPKSSRKLHMAEKFKSTWKPVPRSEPDGWKRGIAFEVTMMPEEIDTFGVGLKERFSSGLIYSSRIQPPMQEVKSKMDASSIYGDPNTKGKVFDSLLDAGRATNAAQAFFRQPWPEEMALGDEDSLMNYRERILEANHEAFRRMGRCLAISWWATPGLRSGHRFRERRDNEVLDCEFHFVASSLKVNFIYDCEDPEAVSFSGDVEAFLLELTTCDFASYDPCTHEIINPNRRNTSQRRSTGVVRYASLHDRVYFDFCHQNGRPPEVMGPRPEVRVAYRKEAGLLP